MNNLPIADGEASLDLGGGWIRVGPVIPLEMQGLGLITFRLSQKKS